MPLMPTSIISANPIAPTGLVTIYDSTLQADAANFDVTNIPGGYKHLSFVLQGRSDRAANNFDFVKVNFNGDTGSNYTYNWLQSAGGTSGDGIAFIRLGVVAASSSAAGDNGVLIGDIPNYASTTFNKIISARGYDRRATIGDYALSGGEWKTGGTAAITQLTFGLENGNWKAGSRLTVYGLGGTSSTYSTFDPNDSSFIIALELFS